MVYRCVIGWPAFKYGVNISQFTAMHVSVHTYRSHEVRFRAFASKVAELSQYFTCARKPPTAGYTSPT